MKRALSLLLVLCMLCGMLASVAVAEETADTGATITVGSVSAAPGATVDVPVTITNNPGFAGFTFDVEYDENALTLTGITGLEAKTSVGAFLADETTKAATYFDAQNVTDDTTLMTLHFTVKDTASTGNHAVSVSLRDNQATNFCNDGGQAVDVTFVPGGVTVTSGEETPEDAPTIYLTSVEGRAGENVTVDICLKNNPGVFSITLTLGDYPQDKLELVNVTDGSVGSAFGGVIVPPDLTKQNLKFNWSCGSVQNISDDGVLAKLTFVITEDTDTATIPLSVSYESNKIVDCNRNLVNFIVENGNISIIDYLYGDADGDGVVGALDILAIRQYMVEWPDLIINEAAADANCDGFIDAFDILLIRQVMVDWPGVKLGPQSIESDQLLAFSASVLNEETSPSFIVSSVKGNVGDTVDVTVGLKNNPGIFSLQASVIFDTQKLKLTGYTNGDFATSLSCITPPNYDTVPHKFNWTANGAIDVNAEGCLITLHFNVLASCDREPVDVGFTCDVDKTININKKKINFGTATGEVSSDDWMHSLTKVNGTPATCTTNGTEDYYKCSTCNELFSDAAGTNRIDVPVVISATGHEYVMEYDKDGHWQECSACQDKQTKTAHDYSAHKCNEEATCKNCSYIKPVGEHSYCGWKVKTAATCFESGVEYRTCSSCSCEDTKSIPQRQHKKVVDVAAKAATCTEAGCTEGWYCEYSDCNYKDESTTIPALGHDKTYVSGVPATCTSTGTMAYYHCDHCGKDYNDEDCTIELTNLTTAKLEHTMQHHDAVSPSCTVDGTFEYWYCSICKTKYADASGNTVRDSILNPATGHSMTHHAAEKPDCTNAGKLEYWYCSNCKTNYADYDGNQVRTNIIDPATGHKMVKHEEVAPTCISAGNVEYWHCSNCNKNFEDKDGNGVLQSVERPATGVHTLTHHSPNAATCTENGNTEYWECSVCGNYFSDENGKNVINDKSSVVLEALGHDYQKKDEDDDKITYECSRCHDTYTEDKVKLPVVPGKLEFPGEQFTDVDKSDWFYFDVKYVYDRGIMDGTGNGEFSPYANLNRAMIVTILYRMEGKPAVSTANTFTDVPSGQWYSEAIEWAAAKGIVEGYGNGTYGPFDAVTREQLAAILYRYATLKGYDVKGDYKLNADASYNAWSKANVEWAANKGILVDGLSVNATTTANRAEVARSIRSFLTRVAK